MNGTEILLSIFNETLQFNNQSGELTSNQPVVIHPLVFWIQALVIPLVDIVGVSGNSISIYVLLTDKKTFLTGNIYLIALAVADTLSMIFSYAGIGILYLIPSLETSLIFWTLKPGFLWLMVCTASASHWIITIFTVERFFAVCYPLASVNKASRRRTAILLMFVYVFCLITNIPVFFEKQPVQIENSRSYKLVLTEFGRNRIYTIVFIFFHIIAYVIIPIPVIMILNVVLIRALIRARAQREVMVQSTHEAEKSRVTVTLVTIVILFFVCHAPYAILSILYTVGVLDLKHWTYSVISSIVTLLLHVNATGNFVLYGLASVQFRNRLISIFLCRGQTKN